MLCTSNTELVTALGCNEGHTISSHLMSRQYLCTEHYIRPIHYSKRVVLTSHYFAEEKYNHSEKFPKQHLSKPG